ncbi:vWA domain-containing protein [Butyrivibrio sp. FCS006]|uniref:vWA domain-containing protein n=1 Tax=Butyrivibrio sp. FCS006 TaxID=1280684 RepID=UPI0004101B1A|nr:tellurium resistance protein [Butyrivibrio sp. FCS006]
MSEQMKRPGGALASRPLHFIWMVDCSGSMSGDKISTANYAIKDAIPGMQKAAEENPNAQLLIRTLKFDDGAMWVTPAPVPVEDFEWDPLDVGGLTSMGAAFNLLSDQLEMPPMSERALPPVIVMLSDGNPTDDYRGGLNRLLSLPWGKKAVKIAIAIGQDVDKAILQEFTCNPELVLPADNAAQLSKMIKWASTVAKQVSSPVSRPVETPVSGSASAPVSTPIDISGIPDPADDPVDDGDVW